MSNWIEDPVQNELIELTMRNTMGIKRAHISKLPLNIINYKALARDLIAIISLNTKFA